MTLTTTSADKRFFESTRGRILVLVREGIGTVSELAGRLGLTDNAVRSHLLKLEGNGLLRQSGLQKGRRKPHYAYELTPEGELRFPKAYDLLLNEFLARISERLDPERYDEVVRAVGRSLVPKEDSGRNRSDTLEQRLARGVNALALLGGVARVEGDGEESLIQSKSCPLAAVVIEHPEVCRVVETLLAEIIGSPVREACVRGEAPRCSFRIAVPSGKNSL